MEFRPVDMPSSEWEEVPPIRIPPGWNPEEWGWQPAFGTYVPDDDKSLELLVRIGEDPTHGWSFVTYNEPGPPDAENGWLLYNPVSVQKNVDDVSDFRVNSVEELQELLTQVQRHGYAEVHADGWTVHAAPTAAMAQDAVEQDHQRRLVHWDVNGNYWAFTDFPIPVPVTGSAPQPTRLAEALDNSPVSRTSPAREASSSGTSLRDVAKRILAAVRPKRGPDHDVAPPQQGLSRGGPQW
ncbi:MULTISPECIES: hypothetical protein [Lentzea]|uniref:Uncharacterized protein n=2 Tax=Lentzea TaxID=165301 RepID=A0A1W2DD02_9PSEU|nr:MULTISPECIES: hypothetical protein [Lentzea]MDX8140547.1 hypothetical protein [Lentzea sp. BCCO 10_0061]SMC95273.1 hypothetical protein SAMN05660733_02891 [Lentzea albidocapillata]